MCGTLGTACGACDPGQMCEVLTGGRGICLPDNRSCGGFVGAICPSSAPHCLMGGSASAWPCATNAELTCICATPIGRMSYSALCP